MIRDWAILDREVIQDFKIFKIEKKQVRSPRTDEISEAMAVRFPDWVIILALTPQEEVVMVRQYRHGIEQVCLELPGGLVDPNEDSPALSAGRELLEETGYQAGQITRIGKCFPQPAILSNACYFYLAEDAERVQTQALDPGEDIEIESVSLTSIPARIARQEINHGMVLLAFFFFEKYLSKAG
jgi:8-oxo-dGTP pyrophosphatase MutT (NUDIX family)